jgi:choline dehydrogenase-like flavoprotein
VGTRGRRCRKGVRAGEPGALGRSIPVPRGKVIGGSTAHNSAAAGRGTPEDYDEWSRLGNPGWSFEQLLDDFRRLEDDPEGDVRYHGSGGGPVPIRRHTDRHEQLARGLEAGDRRRYAGPAEGSPLRLSPSDISVR